jgi:two-component sensor histidine kinase
MSLIHQKIFQSEDIKTIDMADYLPEFIGYLRDSFGRPAHIHFHLDIESLKLGVSQAIPVALIVNEAVTNSIKYAFPGKRPGEIAIRLRQVGEQIELTASDNGIGIDPSMKCAELNTLGIELMKGLSREIKGTIAIETDRGTRIILIFAVDRLNASRTFVIPSLEKEIVI